jgi:hypothetical protein
MEDEAADRLLLEFRDLCTQREGCDLLVGTMDTSAIIWRCPDMGGTAARIGRGVRISGVVFHNKEILF